MSAPHPMLSLYAKIATIANEMLEASKIKDWETLERLERSYVLQVDKLKQIETNVQLNKQEIAQKVDYIQKILATDRAIRQEVEPWMEKLSAMMNTTKTQSKLNKIYGQQTPYQ